LRPSKGHLGDTPKRAPRLTLNQPLEWPIHNIFPNMFASPAPTLKMTSPVHPFIFQTCSENRQMLRMPIEIDPAPTNTRRRSPSMPLKRHLLPNDPAKTLNRSKYQIHGQARTLNMISPTPRMPKGTWKGDSRPPNAST